MRESTEDRMIQILEVVAKELSEIKIACKQCDPAQMQDDLRTLSGVAMSLESNLAQVEAEADRDENLESDLFISREAREMTRSIPVYLGRGSYETIDSVIEVAKLIQEENMDKKGSPLFRCTAEHLFSHCVQVVAEELDVEHLFEYFGLYDTYGDFISRSCGYK